MQLKIKNNLYDIYFGIDALDYLNNAYLFTDDESGDLNLNPMVGEGTRFLVVSLGQNNPVGLAHFIKAGTRTLKSKPSNRAIDEYIAELVTENKLEEACKEALDFLSQAPLTRQKTTAIIQTIEKQTVKKPTKKTDTTKS